MKNPEIEVKDPTHFTKNITKDNGTVKELRMQRAFFNRGDGAVYPFDIMLDRTQSPYPVGTYALAVESFIPDRFGVAFRPTVGAPVDTGAKVKAA